MMLHELTALVAGRLEAVEAAYFVTGSVAASFYASPRHTHDVDIVAEIPPRAVNSFCAGFPAPDFYVDAAAAARAQAEGGQFNIIAVTSALKADIMGFADTPFNRNRMDRKRKMLLDSGQAIYVASPEDVVIMKLKYLKEGGSVKHVADITRMCSAQQANMDFEYLGHWALREGVREGWADICRELGIPLVP